MLFFVEEDEHMPICRAGRSDTGSDTPTLWHCRKSILVFESIVGSRGSKVSKVELSEVPFWVPTPRLCSKNKDDILPISTGSRRKTKSNQAEWVIFHNSTHSKYEILFDEPLNVLFIQTRVIQSLFGLKTENIIYRLNPTCSPSFPWTRLCIPLCVCTHGKVCKQGWTQAEDYWYNTHTYTHTHTQSQI